VFFDEKLRLKKPVEEYVLMGFTNILLGAEIRKDRQV